MQASAVMAVSAYELANLSGIFRGQPDGTDAGAGREGSDSLIVKGKGSN